MKVILINPASKLVKDSWAYNNFCTPIAPLGLCYIAAVLERGGIEVKVVDQFASQISDKCLLQLIGGYSPDIVGFACLTPVLNEVRFLSKQIKRNNEKIKIIWGNAHPTCFSEEVLRADTVDIVVRGEGEETMLELCQKLSEDESLRKVKGISFKENKKIIHNPDRELIDNLDTIPFPAWHLLSLNRYKEVPLAAIYKTVAVPIISSRGCPYRCYYCSQEKFYNKVRYRNIDEVINEIEYFHSKFNIGYFGFSDAYFPYSERCGLEFCDKFIRRGLHKKVRWCTETRVDKVSRELLRRMKEAGAHLIMYGIEVGNQEILDKIGKKTTLDQARYALRETRKANILSLGLFILGLPGETEETCRDTIRFAKELPCDLAKFNIAVPYPGSQFFNDYPDKEKCAIIPERFTSWYDWLIDSRELVFVPNGMISSQLKNLQRKAMFQFYFRPKVIFRCIFYKLISFRNLYYGAKLLIRRYLRSLIDN